MGTASVPKHRMTSNQWEVLQELSGSLYPRYSHEISAKIGNKTHPKYRNQRSQFKTKLRFALEMLEDKGLVVQPMRKYYQITERGKRVLEIRDNLTSQRWSSIEKLVG